MKDLLLSRSPHAEEAIDLFVYRISQELGSLAASLGGLDALVFTAGIGEHAAPIRARVCEQAAWLGAELDSRANDAGALRISTKENEISVWVTPTDEEAHDRTSYPPSAAERLVGRLDVNQSVRLRLGTS